MNVINDRKYEKGGCLILITLETILPRVDKHTFRPSAKEKKPVNLDERRMPGLLDKRPEYKLELCKA